MFFTETLTFGTPYATAFKAAARHTRTETLVPNLETGMLPP